MSVSHVNAWTATQAGAVAAFTAQGTAVPGSDLELRYTYDCADRRIRRSMDADGLAGVGQASVSFAAYAGDVRTLEIAQTATVSAGGRVIDFLGQVVERNFYGNGEDEILAVDKITWNGTTPTTSTFWTFADHQGTIRDIVSGNAADRGKVVEHRQYDSFGKVLARTANLSPGAATLPGSGVGVAFGYTGRPIDEKTGLSDYRARWYDANTGRFINEDPSGFKGGDTNLFRYVGNDPLDRIDPSGLTAKWAGYGGKGSVPAAGWGAYGAGTLLTSGASNSTPTPFVMARAKSSPSFESPFLSGTKAFFGSISDSIVGGVTGLVTGEAGRQLGERAFQITVNNNGGKFNGQWGQVAYNIAGQMAGTHAMAEGAVGIDLASHEAVAAEDRVGRFVGGLGQFAGIAAGGAVMTRSAFGASAFTNLPGSAAVSRLSSSLNSAAGRVWSRVDDAATVGNNTRVPPSSIGETLTHRNGIYEVLSEQSIAGTTRSAHRASANRNFLQQLESDPRLAWQLSDYLGVEDVIRA